MIERDTTQGRPAKLWLSTAARERDRVRTPKGLTQARRWAQPLPAAKPNHPAPQSQSLSRSYGSNLPTSLTYIILSTRGCSPWRPAADMGTSWSESAVISLGFSRSHRPLVALARTASVFAKTKTRSLCERIPGPRRLMQKRQLFPELRWASPSRVALPRRNTRFRNGSTSRFWNKDQIPFRPSCGFPEKNAARLIKVSPKP